MMNEVDGMKPEDYSIEWVINAYQNERSVILRKEDEGVYER